MAQIITNQKKLLTRIRRIKGQASGLEKQIENGSECMAILQQIAAIRGAANGLMKDVLEDHLREHLGAVGLSQEAKEAGIEDIILILKSYLK